MGNYEKKTSSGVSCVQESEKTFCIRVSAEEYRHSAEIIAGSVPDRRSKVSHTDFLVS
jgi:hypothetical protein